ncbi:hypothetical protein EJ07DRAFT_154450 [Lizonia empirigonia]|nr:hypothetical protein EJ07DRAFT_154450 [Lizonia empirigonia]
MAKLKRKDVTPAKSRPPKRARRPHSHSSKVSILLLQLLHRRRVVRRTPIRSPLFEPEASQLATDAQAAAILGEDDNEVEELEPVDDEDQQVQWALEAATAVEELAGNSRSVAAVAAAPSRGITEELEELIEPHLHFRWRACWGNMERALIAAACRFARSKPTGGVTEAIVWQWADKTVEEQKPWVAKVDSLTATLYYTNGRQAKADRCTLALQRRRAVAGETLCLGNWDEFRALVEEMDKESSEVLKCDFDLVLRALEEPSSSQLLARTAAAPARSRPGIVTAIQEEGLAEVVAIEQFASGVAIGIKDYWRCNEGTAYRGSRDRSRRRTLQSQRQQHSSMGS